MPLTRENIYAVAAKKGIKRTLSFSQFSLFSSCRLHWKLKYIDKIDVDTPSIHLLFGTAIHNVLQKYLEVMFAKTIKEANEIDTETFLRDSMKEEFLKIAKKNPEIDFTNQKQMVEFYNDGLEILNNFKKKRKLFFSNKEQELIGIEFPLLIQFKNKPSLGFIAFLDVLSKEIKTQIHTITDFKTSTMGWKKEKKDLLKIAQLILYKIFLAEQLGIPIEQIKTEFIILKRKLFENAAFPQKRIQHFQPPEGKVTVNRVKKLFNEFIDIFDDEGKVKEGVEFTMTEEAANCQYCPFKKTQYCSKYK